MGSCQATKKKSPENSKESLEIQIPSKKNEDQSRRSVLSQVKSAGLEKKQTSSQRQSVFVSQIQGTNNSMSSPQIKTKARMSTPVIDVVKIEQECVRAQKHKCTFKMNATIKKSAFCKFYSVQQYEKGSQPRGGYGTVLVSQNLTGKLMYAEYLDNSEESKKYVQELMKHQFSHPNIVNVVEILEDKSQFVVIKECIQGQRLTYSEPQEKQMIIIKQIIEAVSYLHSLKLTHGALCLDAFEIKDDLVKLIDLKSIFIRHEPNHHDIEYLAPECTIDSFIYSKERDIWAVGMMIHNIMNGKHFQVSGLQEIMKEVVQIRINKHIHIEGENKDFIEQFLHITVQKRIRLLEALEHPFFYQKDKQQLKLDPIIKRNKHLKEITIIQQCLLLLFINQFEDEKYKYQQLFQAIDQDHDGKISKKDCYTLFPELEDDVYFIFNLIQIKEKMSFQEFLILAVDRKVILTESNIETIFNLYSTMKKCIHSNTLINIYQSRENELKEAFELEDHPYLNYEKFQNTLRKLL